MSRINLVKLRKRAGMSQRDLADKLQVRPSFLSAIENGRSRLPEEKMLRLKEIFEVDNLEEYMVPDEGEIAETVPPHTHPYPTDSLTQLLNQIHQMAHQHDHTGHDNELEDRLDFLTKRNDKLSERLDDLREKVDRLQEENFRLKELLIFHGIKFQ